MHRPKGRPKMLLHGPRFMNRPETDSYVHCFKLPKSSIFLFSHFLLAYLPAHTHLPRNRPENDVYAAEYYCQQNKAPSLFFLFFLLLSEMPLIKRALVIYFGSNYIWKKS